MKVFFLMQIFAIDSWIVTNTFQISSILAKYSVILCVVCIGLKTLKNNLVGLPDKI